MTCSRAGTTVNGSGFNRRDGRSTIEHMITVMIEDPYGERSIVNCTAGRLRIGSGRRCDACLKHETVSRRHAEIVLTASGLVVRDLASHGGTHLNGKWITESAAQVGDVVQVGRHRLTILSAEGEPVAAEGTSSAGSRHPSAGRRLAIALLLSLCLLQAAVLLHVIVGVEPASPDSELAAGEGGAVDVEPAHAGHEDTEPLPMKAEGALAGAAQDDAAPDHPAPRHAAVQAPMKRGTFRGGAVSLTPQEEILARRAYLDLAGRPPTIEELEAHGADALALLVRDLIGLPEVAARAGGDPDALLRQALGLDGNDRRSRMDLCLEYAHALPRLPRRAKDPVTMAASLVVDLWQRAPTPDETTLIADALSLGGDMADAQPVAAFLLGSVEEPEDTAAWTEQVLARFLMRLPSANEVKEVAGILARQGAARGVILGLAGSDAYRSF